jgi:thiol-disulfide isomerase/thioredoxin
MAKNSLRIEYAIFATFILVLVVLLLNSSNVCEKFFSADKRYSLEYFYMNGCGHCDSFNSSGVWEKLKSNHPDKCSFKKYELNQSKERVKKFDITGFPTILLVDKDTDKKISEFTNQRTYENLERFINKL